MRIDTCRSRLAVAGLLVAGALTCGAQATTLAKTTTMPPPAATALARATPGYFPDVPTDEPRITATVSNGKLATIAGSQLSPAFTKFDAGAVAPTAQIGSMTLLLKRSDEKEGQFRGYLSELTRPGSPYFHHWLTAAQVGTMFGPAASDIGKVKQWLSSQGFNVRSVSPDGMLIRFGGSASAVQTAFHTRLHNFKVDGQTHFGNLDAQQIPAALAPVVQGVASLGNFFPKAQHVDIGTVVMDRKSGAWKTVSKATASGNGKAQPMITVPPGTADPNITYDMTPADFNQVYNVKPLWSKGNRGAGQTVVLLERTNINLADVTAFRKAFLPADAAGMVSIVHPNDAAGDNSCLDPGITGDEGEAALDVEWAGAAAPDANIVLASCADVGSNFGPLLAANLYQQDGQHGLPPSAPPILSLSYGACEINDAGDTNLADILWSSLAAQGATTFVSTGDAGSAGCDQGALFGATYGPEANGMASSPSDVAVGGTDFNDRGKISQYWSPTNQALYQSAISYIPEQTWNNSCAGVTLYTLLGYTDGVTACNDSVGRGQDYLQIGGGGGGASFVHGQAEWQEGIYGSTNHQQRTIPDVSLFSANGIFGHALVYCMSDASEGGTTCDYSNPDDVYFNSAGGTSFAAPTMAGVQALINAAVGDRSGNILPALYNIGAKEYGTNGAPNTQLLAACNSSKGASEDSTCVFNDVTVGDIVQPCFSGSIGCYSGTNLSNQFGITEGGNGGSQTLSPAWQTNAGYDQATGLGTVNVSNLVNAIVKYDQPLRGGTYAAPADFLSLNAQFSNDGYSDIALVDPAKGTLSSLAMKGNVELSSVPQPLGGTGYRVGAIGNFAPSFDLLGLKADDLAIVDPDNGLYLWASTAIGGFFPYPAGTPYPVGWTLMGSAMVDSTRMQELFWFNAQTSQFSWLKIDLSLDTGLPVTSASPAMAGVAGYTPTLADVNGDGYADIVWTSGQTFVNDVQIWINDQNGGFVKSKVAGRAKNFTLYGAGDIDGDGKTDLIWTNPQTHQMMWWLMNGTQVVAQQTRSFGPNESMAGIADYDGDGRADILWLNTNGTVTEWLSTGTDFLGFDVADAFGSLLKIPAGTQIQINRLQGSAIAGHH
ncbi:protease pro-enzyme activation domain-containing protein [Rhodanobacter sp. L36]|uniref:protease pro-enzyme activation domain-containing protein n=1 Tax=Rhodanobacter sp. L36 TaxID=1747221 RepID=UPI00131CE552|nr:protease pro-enzyme activation domain-containing protein [Rhodanobacter sp. L36]